MKLYEGLKWRSYKTKSIRLLRKQENIVAIKLHHIQILILQQFQKIKILLCRKTKI